jgi:hypothetical protein
VVLASQLTTFVLLYSCNKNANLKVEAVAQKQVSEKSVNKIHYKHWSVFYWFLHIMDLIVARKVKHSENH